MLGIIFEFGSPMPIYRPITPIIVPFIHPGYVGGGHLDPWMVFVLNALMAFLLIALVGICFYGLYDWLTEVPYWSGRSSSRWKRIKLSVARIWGREWLKKKNVMITEEGLIGLGFRKEAPLNYRKGIGLYEIRVFLHPDTRLNDCRVTLALYECVDGYTSMAEKILISAIQTIAGVKNLINLLTNGE